MSSLYLMGNPAVRDRSGVRTLSRARWIRALACAALPFALSACSDETKMESTTGDPGPKDPVATGAVNMEVYATETQSCPPGNVHIDVGTVNSSPPIFAMEGEDGAKVVCSVAKGTGSNFAVSATIEKGKFSFAVSDLETSGSSALGRVEFSDPAAGTRYASSSEKPCIFQFAPGTAQGVGEGKLFVQFDCADLVSADDPKATCSARYGYLRIFNCEPVVTPP